MAMGGPWVLAKELDASPEDIPAALIRYEERVKPAIAAKQRAGRGMARWFVPETRIRMALRSAILRFSPSPLGAWLVKREIAGESVVR
jgi:2-polyprenyl-6-methoxyphenol hydroxylase-like FAD-dependent oxidoreductase